MLESDSAEGISRQPRATIPLVSQAFAAVFDGDDTKFVRRAIAESEFLAAGSKRLLPGRMRSRGEGPILLARPVLAVSPSTGRFQQAPLARG
jgi:hypothetical protein